MKHSVVPLKPICVAYRPEQELAGGAQFKVLHTLKELSNFWRQRSRRLLYVARGRRWGDRQFFLNPGEWVFAPSIPVLVRAVTRWEAMDIRVEWHDRSQQEADSCADYLTQTERFNRLIRAPFVGEAGSHEFEPPRPSKSGYWQLKLPASLRSFPWFSQQSDRIHYPGLSAELAAEIFQLRTYEDWRASNMREVDFMSAEDLDDLIGCCQSSLFNPDSQ